MSCKPCHFSGNGRNDFASNFQLVHFQRRLACLGRETRSFDTNQIAKIEEFENPHRFRTEFFCVQINLDPSTRVLQIDEVTFAHVTVRGDPAGNAKIRILRQIFPAPGRYHRTFRTRPRNGATPSFSSAANFSRRNASNSLSSCSMPATDSRQNQGEREHSVTRWRHSPRRTKMLFRPHNAVAALYLSRRSLGEGG